MNTTTAFPRDAATAREAANAGWAEAVRVYRASVDIYRHAMELRARREAARLSRRVTLGPVAVHVPTAVEPRPSVVDVIAAAPNGTRLAALTAREREVALLIARGYSNQQIAERLVLTRGTVANHVAHILGKLGVGNRTAVAALVFQRIPTPN
jgi:DNA-binding NarL/FixJ family response regulator